MSTIRQAVILAGGKGTRLRPYTTVLPKPLMPIGEFPILEILIRKLKKSGITEIVIATGYLSHLIVAYFGNGEKFDVNITYSHETKPLGTAAPLKLIESLDDQFLVMNGDLLTDLSFIDFANYHLENKNVVTVCIYQKEVKIDLGVLKLSDTQKIIDYIEKPVYNFSVSMGIYAMDKSVLDFLPENEYYDLPNLILKLIEENEKLGGYNFKGIWLDIGRPADYQHAIDLFESDEKERFLS